MNKDENHILLVLLEMFPNFPWSESIFSSTGAMAESEIEKKKERPSKPHPLNNCNTDPIKFEKKKQQKNKLEKTKEITTKVIPRVFFSLSFKTCTTFFCPVKRKQNKKSVHNSKNTKYINTLTQ